MEIIDFKNKNNKKNLTLTKNEVMDKIKEQFPKKNLRLPYIKELKKQFKDGSLQTNNMYWSYDSTSPVYFNDKGEMNTFRKMKGQPQSKAFYFFVDKKPWKGGVQPNKSKKKVVEKSENINTLDALSDKIDKILEAMEMNSMSYKSNTITITKGDIKIEL
jgi:hypothetical protein